MVDDENVPNASKPLEVRMEISAPVSIALHPSGEMDVIFRNSASGIDPRLKERIRFAPLAALQLLAAIHAAVQNGNIVFSEDQQETFH
ncbi:hypothetical protein KDW41_29730 [Burkholderia vietnamiensis]|nr:hypothetical protein [Burkholderia vietnamiensis]